MVARGKIVGIGAMNVDYILEGQAPDRWLKHLHLPAHDKDDEIPVGDEVLAQIMAEAAPGALRRAAGGSSLNAIRAIARLNAGFDLGFVGCMGGPEADPLIAGVLQDLSIEAAFVWKEPRRIHGTCIALTNRGQRLLLTGLGANAGLAKRLRWAQASLAAHLATASAVHVTSSLDPDVPGLLAGILAAVRQAAPEMMITVDPGAIWSAAHRRDGSIVDLVRLADVIFLNPSEARAWFGSAALDGFLGTIVVKGADGARAYIAGGTDEIVVRTAPLPSRDIHHPVGAGDTFAAGVIATLAMDRRALPAALKLGHAMARFKLTHGEPLSPAGYEKFWVAANAQEDARERPRHALR